MARFLVYTSPARGHLYPITATLLELRRRGHEVHVRTLAAEVGALRAAGLQAAPLAPEIEDIPLDDWHGATPVEALQGGLRVVHEGSDLQRAIVDVAPDFLIVDITTAGAAAVAEASGLPWAQWVPFFQHFEPIRLDAPELTWIPFTLLPAGIEVIDDGRRRAGLEPLAGPAEARRAPLYLYFTAEPFEIPGLDLPPSVRLVGPGLWEPAADVAVEPDGTGEPLVLVTASSEFQRDDGLVATALRGLADERVRVLASSVSHDPREFDVPANARVERWLPHGPAIRRSACVVCHGGMGSRSGRWPPVCRSASCRSVGTRRRSHGGSWRRARGRVSTLPSSPRTGCVRPCARR
ncbi:glycosyltransferase [soil metagenome]